ncbi:HepT-like ribonuclease domain-containing protein [Methanocalculus sp. MC3]
MRSRKEVVSLLKGLKAEMAASFGVTQLGVFTPPLPGDDALHVIAAFSEDRDLLDMAALSCFIEKRAGQKIVLISLKGLRDQLTPCIMQAEPLSQAQVLLFQREIIRSITDIELSCRGIIYEVFLSDAKTSNAVLSHIRTIGILSSCIPDEYKEASPSVPWDALGALPGMISPCYGTDLRLVWNCVQRRLPQIREALETLPGMNRSKEGARRRFF